MPHSVSSLLVGCLPPGALSSCAPRLHLRRLQTMLPVFCTARAATVALALLEVAATKWDGYLSDLCSRENKKFI